MLSCWFTQKKLQKSGTWNYVHVKVIKMNQQSNRRPKKIGILSKEDLRLPFTHMVYRRIQMATQMIAFSSRSTGGPWLIVGWWKWLHLYYSTKHFIC